MMIKKLQSAVMALAFAGFLATSANAAVEKPVKIGLVDMQAALTSVADGKKAKSEIESEYNSKKKELESEQAAIQKMDEEFKKQHAVMSADARNKKGEELRKRFEAFQRKTQMSQMEIQRKQEELTQPIIKKLWKIVDDLAEKREYTLILEKDKRAVLHSRDQDDLTRDVIAAYDSENKSKK